MTEYNTLEALDQRKQQLKNELSKEENEIKTLWDGLFHAGKKKPLIETPTQKLMRYASMSTGVIDGALLGWKLYRKFKK